MKPEILVTGASGNVGSEVVRCLQNHDVPFRIASRNTTKAKEIWGDNTEIVAFDFLDAKTFKASFDGIKRMFLVRPPHLANVQKQIAPTVYAAVEAGVQHIVFLSLQGVENNRMTPHYKIEQLLQQLDVSYTFLRAGFFMQNLSTIHRDEIRDERDIALPIGKAPTSFIDVRDIAAVGAQSLMHTKHENKAYVLTGKEALDYYQVAEIMSDVLQYPIHYSDPSVFRFFLRQIKRDREWGYTLVMTALYTITRFGNAKDISPDVEQVLGRDPITFRQFVEDYRECWQS